MNQTIIITEHIGSAAFFSLLYLLACAAIHLVTLLKTYVYLILFALLSMTMLTFSLYSIQTLAENCLQAYRVIIR